MISDPVAPAFARHFDVPLCIYEHAVPPNDAAIIILDWTCWLSFWIGDCRRVLCETPELADKVRRKLESEDCEPMPLIRFREVCRAA